MSACGIELLRVVLHYVCKNTFISYVGRKVSVEKREESEKSTKETAMKNRDTGLFNTKTKDSSSKLIFEDPILCAQFLRDYINIPMLKNVQPEDIEDETERFVHMFSEERNSDVVKKIRIHRSELKTVKKYVEIPFYLVSLIEHKSEVDYNVIMQVFRYIAFIWEDYEKKMDRKHQQSR